MGYIWTTLPWIFCHFSVRGISLLFCKTVPEKEFDEVSLFILHFLNMLWDTTSSQIYGILKISFYYCILKCNCNKINESKLGCKDRESIQSSTTPDPMKSNATAYFHRAKNDVKSVKQHTWTWYFAENYMLLRRKWRQEYKVCELRTLPTFWHNVLYTRIQLIISSTKKRM